MERIVDLPDEKLAELEETLDRFPYAAVQDLTRQVKSEREDRALVAQLREALFPHDELH